MSRSGSALPSANTETWNYNAKGEVVAADHSTNNAFDRSFQFDGIGNRKKSANSLTLPASDNYTSNALNQYDAVGVVARTFDDDGNLTDDGTKQFVWDAENRLIEVKNTGGTVATYAYDFGSRRISKTIGSTITSFVYDGWNPIAEFSGTTLSKSYTWGMDLSGGMQGAGGVGGLLAVNETSASYYPTMDGNGNISEYVDATGTSVAHYEYDAFGQAVASGTKANDFSHQFSTKQLDTETGLHYYGYRYYDATVGRWMGRDPIEELGGLNVYGFINNKTINHIDRLGLTIDLSEVEELSDFEGRHAMENYSVIWTQILTETTATGVYVISSKRVASYLQWIWIYVDGEKCGCQRIEFEEVRERKSRKFETTTYYEPVHMWSYGINDTWSNPKTSLMLFGVGVIKNMGKIAGAVGVVTNVRGIHADYIDGVVKDNFEYRKKTTYTYGEPEDSNSYANFYRADVGMNECEQFAAQGLIETNGHGRMNSNE